ncbi:DUF6894 family protein [Rhizobium sp.]|uniref:DUF6894 family protein n=1 Tax=Rhizobium sp. TaxID=391 RepID=UPI0028A2B302
MIRLYFHIREGDRLSKDPEGADFQDVQTARTEAVRSARELLSQRVLNGEEIDGQSFELPTRAVLSWIPSSFATCFGCTKVETCK